MGTHARGLAQSTRSNDQQRSEQPGRPGRRNSRIIEVRAPRAIRSGLRSRPRNARFALAYGELGQDVGRGVAALRESPQLVDVTSLTSELDELVDRVSAAAAGKTSRLVRVARWPGQLDPGL